MSLISVSLQLFKLFPAYQKLKSIKLCCVAVFTPLTSTLTLDTLATLEGTITALQACFSIGTVPEWPEYCFKR